MRTLCCLFFLGWLLWVTILASDRAFAADEPSSPASYRETPGPFRLFLDQWSTRPPLPDRYTLEFVRSADDEQATLTLREAVLAGVANNPGITVDRLEPLKTVEETFRETSVFDPVLALEFNKDFDIDPRGSRSSAFSTALQATRNRNYNLSLKKLLRTGSQLDFSFLNNRLISNFPTQALKPQYRPHLEFSLSQPLLRDFGWGLTTIFIRIAENREGISSFDYRARLSQLIQRITEAYWAVVFAKENLTVQNKGVELAEALLNGAQARVRAGVLPPVALIEAQAEKARREELVIRAENNQEIAGTNLRLTLNVNPSNKLMPRKIEPAEAPMAIPYQTDRLKSREVALTRRPEILSANLNIQNRALQARYAENQLLPRLDLKAGAGLTGLAGELKPGQSNPFDGSYGTALDRVGSGKYYNYSVGVVLQFPLGNAQARSNYSRAAIELDQAKARMQDIVSQITREVETASAEAEANWKRIQSTRLSRQFAEENLRGQEKRYEVGLVTQKDVIDFQTRFLEARGAELRALVDSNNSLARVKLAEGTLLDYYNIKIEEPHKESDPWWARF